MVNKPLTENKEDFKHESERFGELQILRYRVPGFEELDLKKKILLYYLYEAALWGRDIIYDQNYTYNLRIRQTLEAILEHVKEPSPELEQIRTYAKRFWFSNGLHHHYSTLKFLPEFGVEVLVNFVRKVPVEKLPLKDTESLDDLLAELEPVIFNGACDHKRVNKDRSQDLVTSSAVNYYEGVTEAEVQRFYAKQKDRNDPCPPPHGLNSKLVKENGALVERVWKLGGMYSEPIAQMVFWLEKAVTMAENQKQKKALETLIQFYREGDLSLFDRYCIEWLEDTESDVDVVHGFIEVYNDPLGFKGTFEAMVSVKDKVATKRIATIAKAAGWFEAHMPYLEAHKKDKVEGVCGSVINVVVESGDCSPTTPIGVNLPNSDWIRERYGSKSVNLANIVTAYNQVKGPLLEEFSSSDEEIARGKRYGELGDNLHTDLHEVIGHGSGKLEEKVATPKETLKNYASTLEEARADLVALYFLMDPKLVELGLMPSLETGKAEYDSYIRNGLMVQLRRLKVGENLEEDHMRNRQLVALWAYKRGLGETVIERVSRDGQTYFQIRDYEKLRALFGQLLREIQRIKSQGDFEAGRDLVENYGVQVDTELHQEVLERAERLNLPTYFGFINPKLELVRSSGNSDAEIVDVSITYPDDFETQMLEYAKNYSTL